MGPAFSGEEANLLSFPLIGVGGGFVLSCCLRLFNRYGWNVGRRETDRCPRLAVSFSGGVARSLDCR